LFQVREKEVFLTGIVEVYKKIQQWFELQSEFGSVFFLFLYFFLQLDLKIQ